MSAASVCLGLFIGAVGGCIAQRVVVALYRRLKVQNQFPGNRDGASKPNRGDEHGLQRAGLGLGGGQGAQFGVNNAQGGIGRINPVEVNNGRIGQGNLSIYKANELAAAGSTANCQRYAGALAGIRVAKASGNGGDV